MYCSDIPDGTGEEARKFLKQQFSLIQAKAGQYLITEDSSEKMADFALNKVDWSFLSLSSLIAWSNKYESVEEIEHLVIENYENRFKRDCRRRKKLVAALGINSQSDL